MVAPPLSEGTSYEFYFETFSNRIGVLYSTSATKAIYPLGHEIRVRETPSSHLLFSGEMNGAGTSTT